MPEFVIPCHRRDGEHTIRGEDVRLEPSGSLYGESIVTLKCGSGQIEVPTERLLRVVRAIWELQKP